MNYSLMKKLAGVMRDIANDIDAGNSNLSEEEALDILNLIIHQAVSKEEACSYLNLSRSRFDDLIREGRIPKGRKRKGWKELIWYKDELEKCK